MFAWEGSEEIECPDKSIPFSILLTDVYGAEVWWGSRYEQLSCLSSPS